MARTEKDMIYLNPLTGAIDLVAANAPEDKAEQELMVIKSGFSDEQRRTTQLIGERIGRKQVLTAVSKLVTVTDLVDIQNIKEAKIYKGFQIFINEKPVTITTFEEYCLHVEGRSYESIKLDLANLKHLGGEFFDAMRQIGIGPSTMRDYRKLPDNEKQALMDIAHDGDKDSFIELASALIIKHEKEKSAVTKQLEESAKSLESKDMMIQNKDKKINELDQKLNRKLIDDTTLPPGQEQLDALSYLTRVLTAKISATLKAQIIQLFNEFEDQPTHIRLAAAQSIGQVITAAYDLAADMALTVELRPDKAANDPAKQDAEDFLAWQAEEDAKAFHKAANPTAKD